MKFCYLLTAIAFLLLLLLLFVGAYRKGLRDGMSAANMAAVPPLFARKKKPEPLPTVSSAQNGMEMDLERQKVIAENIENFGTGRPQKEVVTW